nr:ABC transporter ATP-binding protein [Heyndrickxia coagulans]
MKKPVIEFRNYTFQYRSQATPTLHDINLTIYEGESVLILGQSGSGKSTLGHCINGLIPFSYKGEVSGSLKINGKETKDMDIFSISKSVGTVLQDPDGQFIGLTVGEDIAFALENEGLPLRDMHDAVDEAARTVGIRNKLAARVHELSGGQKQKVSLAGVMVNNTGILLFDEPLANLDPATGKQAMELISDIRKKTNVTVLIIEHRLEDVLAEKIDRVIVIDDGKIISDCTPDELLSSSVLETCHVREPLYVKAAKYAGCRITPEMQPAHLDTFQLGRCRDALLNWYKHAKKPVARIETEPVLEIRQLSFSYKPGQPVLKNLSFTIQKGEMVSIVGKNGAGKSTLSRLICGFEQPSSGKIFYKEKDITNDTIKERSLRIGMVMQNPNQMISKHMIFDEIALGLANRGIAPEEIKSRTENAMRLCGLYSFRNWPVSALSFGQKKRVTIASILVLEPDILILDEPTAGQDYMHYHEIMEFLVELNKKGITILFITHDMHLMLEYTPRAIVLADGEKIADGPAAGILGHSDMIRRANLKETSLYTLASRLHLNPERFTEHFITYERGL